MTGNSFEVWKESTETSEEAIKANKKPPKSPSTTQTVTKTNTEPAVFQPKSKPLHNIMVTSEELAELMKMRELLEKNDIKMSPDIKKSKNTAHERSPFSDYQHIATSSNPTAMAWHKSLRN